jgi:uncharacterized protein (DUF983 family)
MQESSVESEHPRLSPLRTGLRCRCPRCGKGPLLRGFLKIRDRCPNCGLDYGFADPADGPAFFAMSGVGLVIMGLFAWIEVAYRPAIWFHFAFTLPLLVVGCLAVLRPIKGWLVASQYYFKAEESRFESVGKHGPF